MEREIYCTNCERNVQARLTSGAEIYPHRPDLCDVPFWKCVSCGNYVGCHWKSTHPTKPLGVIPTPELRLARNKIHAVLDPLWKKGHIERKALYQRMGNAFGHKFQYHTAMIRSVEEAEIALKAAFQIKDELLGKSPQESLFLKETLKDTH